MSINPITGSYMSPFGSATTGLPTFDAPTRWDNAPGTMVGRALGRGVDMIQGNIGSAIEGIGNVTGMTGVAAYGAEVAARNAQERAASQAMEGDGPLSYLVGLLGENAPQMAVSVGLPLAGAAIGALAGPGGAVAGFGAGMTAARGAALGTAASMGFNYALLAGEARETQREVNEERGEGTPIDEGRAFGAAVPAAAMETLAGRLLARAIPAAARARLAPPPGQGALRSVAGAAGRGAATEGATEIGQQAIMRAQADQSLTDSEAMQDFAAAGLAGAILGGSMRGAARSVGALREVREQPPSQATNEGMQATIDRALGLTPPTASPLAQARAQPPMEQALAPVPVQETPAPNPLTNARADQLLVDLQATEQRLVSGQETADDANNLRMLRAEIARREQAAPPEAAPEQFGQRLMQNEAAQSLNAALRVLNGKAESEALSDQESALRDTIRAELAARKQPAPVDRDQGSLFAEMSPEFIETRDLARRSGLSPRSKFYNSLQARTPQELFDAVADGVERAEADAALPTDGDLNKALPKIAYELGITRDFDAEIADALAARDKIQADTGLKKQEDAEKFKAAQRKVADLQERQRVVAAFMAARAERKAQAAAQVQEPQAAPMAQAPQAAPRDPFEGIDITVAPPNETAIAEKLRKAALKRQREQAFAQAEAQRQEQRFREAETAPDVEPTPEPAPTREQLALAERRAQQVIAEREGAQAQRRQMQKADAAMLDMQRRAQGQQPVAQAAPAQTAPTGMAARLQEAFAAKAQQTAQQQRQATFDQARGQQQDQRATEVARAQIQADSEPVRVVNSRQAGPVVEAMLTRGDPIRLERRKDGWYSDGQFVSRDLKAAQEALMTRRDADVGIVRSVRRDMAPEPKTQPGTRLHRVAVKNAVARAARDYNLGDVTVVDSAADLSSADVDGIPGGTTYTLGYMRESDGAVFIIADAHATPEAAVATLFHETLGHRGLRRAYGAAREQLLMDMYDGSPALRETVAEWRTGFPDDMFDDTYGQTPFHTIVEEAIAWKSEKGPIQATFLDRMAKLIGDFLRRIGMRVTLNNRQVRAIVAQAHEAAMQPGGVESDLTVLADVVPSRPQRGPVATPLQVQQAANTYGNPVIARRVLMTANVAASGVPSTPRGAQTIIERVVKMAKAADTAVRNMASKDAKEALRSGAVYFQSLNHLVLSYGDMFKITTREGVQTNALAEVQRGRDLRASVREIYGRIAAKSMDGFAKLSEKAQSDVLDLMGATFLQLDPTKRLEDHAHLTPRERADRRAAYDRLVEARNRLGRSGDLDVYNQMKQTMRATYLQQHAMDLYDLIRNTPEVRAQIPSAQRNPILQFTERSGIHSDLTKVEKFWSDALDGLMADTTAFIQAQGRRAIPSQDAARIRTLVSTLQDQMVKTTTERQAMNNYPYFHLGRFGKYYASFQLRSIKDADGKAMADPAAVEAVAKALHELGFENVVLSESADGPTVFIRTEHRSGADAIEAMAQRMVAEGFVDGSKSPMAGEVDPLQELPEGSRAILNNLLVEVEAANAPTVGEAADVAEARVKYVARLKADMQAAFLARLPDASVAKVMARRGFRAGFDRDMLRSFASRMQVASNSSAARLAANISGEGIKEMQSAVTAAREGNPDRWAMTTVLREVMQREADAPDTMASNYVDALRSLNHNYFLAMNPGYWLTQITQLQTNLWPELVKGGASYREAFGSMQRAFGPAFSIVKATLADAKARGFKEYGADSTVTTDVLSRVQLSKDPVQDAELKTFVMRMMHRGVIDIGSASRELGRKAEGKSDSAFDTTMRWAASGSYYLEVMTRLTAAISAREIALKQGKQGDAAIEYAAHVVRESMLDYTESNRARAFGKRGMAGEFTPLGTAFLSFQFMMIEKYMRETYTAFSGDTPQERAAARRWLGSHLAVMTTLAGSLGLPFVTVIARVIDALGDLLGDDEEPFDIKSAYRNFLSDTFGQDVGEVLARGLPRATGFDISGRIGAADYFPFSRLIADRRNWDDALADFTTRTYGAPFSMLTSMLKGGQMIADGRIMDGLREAVPVGIKNPLEAMRLTSTGMTDRRGNLLPIEPTAMDTIWQALGLTPARRAEYSEANFSQAVRRNVASTSAATIRRDITRAIQTGDQEALREGLARAREFDANVSPSMAIMPGLAASVTQAERRRRQAQAMGTPMGVRPNDVIGRDMVRFANY